MSAQTTQTNRAAQTMQTEKTAVPAGTEAEKVLGVLLPEEQRPAPSNALTASITFGWRAMLKIKHIPTQLFDVTIFPIIMTVMFTYIFGGAMGAVVSGTGQTGGVAVSEYVQFFIPGIFVQTLIMITMYTGMTLNKDISKASSTASARCPPGGRRSWWARCWVIRSATPWRVRSSWASASRWASGPTAAWAGCWRPS